MTKIEWTDEVWNPVTGCTKVSQGCKNCYAERIANRFWGDQTETTGKFRSDGTEIYRRRQFTDVICHKDRLDIPLHWRKPRRVFVNSMSDLFHEDVDFGFTKKVFRVMYLSLQHTFQILTKRPERMFEFTNWMIENQIYMPVRNAWLGVSVENQATADERIPWLLQTPAAVRFVSYEPALGPVAFGEETPEGLYSWLSGDLETGMGTIEKPETAPKIDWIIAGGESGPGARPAHPDWFRSVRDQCIEAGVPFFLEQMVVFNGKMVKMPELDGRVWDQYPEAH